VAWLESHLGVAAHVVLVANMSLQVQSGMGAYVVMSLHWITEDVGCK